MAKASINSLESTAYHEAGHAIMHLELRLPFRRATILAKDDTLGSVTGYHLGKKFFQRMEIGFTTPHDDDKIKRVCMCVLAGAEAERRFTGRYNHRGASSDYQRAVDFVLSIQGSNKAATAYYKYLLVSTRELIEAPHIWEAIARVAESLLKQKTLSFKEVVGLWRPMPSP